jgi:hypothetical protein
LLDVCHTLYDETLSLGLGDADMVAVIRAIVRRRPVDAAGRPGLEALERLGAGCQEGGRGQV